MTNYTLILLKGLSLKEQIEELKELADMLERHDGDLNRSQDDNSHCVTFEAPDCNGFDIERLVLTYAGEKSFVDEGYKVSFIQPEPR